MPCLDSVCDLRHVEPASNPASYSQALRVQRLHGLQKDIPALYKTAYPHMSFCDGTCSDSCNANAPSIRLAGLETRRGRLGAGLAGRGAGLGAGRGSALGGLGAGRGSARGRLGGAGGRRDPFAVIGDVLLSGGKRPRSTPSGSTAWRAGHTPPARQHEASDAAKKKREAALTGMPRLSLTPTLPYPSLRELSNDLMHNMATPPFSLPQHAPNISATTSRHGHVRASSKSGVHGALTPKGFTLQMPGSSRVVCFEDRADALLAMMALAEMNAQSSSMMQEAYEKEKAGLHTRVASLEADLAEANERAAACCTRPCSACPRAPVSSCRLPGQSFFPEPVLYSLVFSCTSARTPARLLAYASHTLPPSLPPARQPGLPARPPVSPVPCPARPPPVRVPDCPPVCLPSTCSRARPHTNVACPSVAPHTRTSPAPIPALHRRTAPPPHRRIRTPGWSVCVVAVRTHRPSSPAHARFATAAAVA